MKVRSKIRLMLPAMLVALLSIAALAKHESNVNDENVALVLGNAGEQYPIFGSGGIRVTGGHHGFWSSNVKTSAIQIDGSGVSAQNFNPVSENADFTALPNCAYFVSQTCVCTLSTAVGSGGREIVVCNAGKGTTITYKTDNGATFGGGIEVTSNSSAGKVDRFIADGKSWYKE